MTDQEKQYVAAAEQIGNLPELCTWKEYDPDIGAVPGHWVPRSDVLQLMAAMASPLLPQQGGGTTDNKLRTEKFEEWLIDIMGGSKYYLKRDIFGKYDLTNVEQKWKHWNVAWDAALATLGEAKAVAPELTAMLTLLGNIVKNEGHQGRAKTADMLASDICKLHKSVGTIGTTPVAGYLSKYEFDRLKTGLHAVVNLESNADDDVAIYAAPVAQALPVEVEKPLTYEQRHAIKEGERNAASSEYFRARTPLMNTSANLSIFDAGFDRGFDAGVQGEKA